MTTYEQSKIWGKKDQIGSGMSCEVNVKSKNKFDVMNPVSRAKHVISFTTTLPRLIQDDGALECCAKHPTFIELLRLNFDCAIESFH